MRVIDMECSVPKRATNEGEAPAAGAPPAAPGAPAAERPAGYGMANYERIFRSRREGGDARPATELSAYVKLLERVGIVRAVLSAGLEVDYVVVTAKDAVKLRRLWPAEAPEPLVAVLTLCWESRGDLISECLNSVTTTTDS